MGRKKKQLPRSRIIGLRVTEELYEILEKDARASRMNLSDYIRGLILGKTPTAHYDVVFNDPEILKIFHDLSGYSNNLNQIARYLNSGGTMTNPLWKEVRNCMTKIDEICFNLRNYLGEYREPYAYYK